MVSDSHLVEPPLGMWGIAERSYAAKFLQSKNHPLLGDFLMVEPVRRNLHSIVKETRRWRQILYPEYEKFRLNTSLL